MSARVLKKDNHGGKTPELMGVVSPGDLELLERYIEQGAVAEPKRARLGVVLATLEQLETWLAVTNADNREELYTVVNRTGFYHLRRFARELAKVIEGNDPPHRPLNGVILDFHHCFGVAVDRSTETNSDSHGSHESDGTRQLGSFFYQIYEESGLSTWRPPFSAGSAANRLAIGSAMRKFFLADGIPAHVLFFPVYSSFFAAKACKILASLKNSWPKGGRPYALFVAVAKQVEDRKMVIFGQDGLETVHIAGALRRPGAVGTAGPFLVMFTFAEIATGDRYSPIKAFAIPILTPECWLPVESNHERRLLEPLKRLVEHGAALGWPLILKKPMLDISYVGEKRAVRPDYILKWREEMLSIEVLGSDTPEYLKRKKEMGAVLERYGKYVPIDASKTSGVRQEREQENALLVRVNEWISRRL